MKRALLFLLLIIVSFSISGCNSSTKWTDDIDSFDEFSMRLDDMAGSVDLALDIKTSDLCVDDIETAVAYLDMYLYGDYYTKKQLRDAVTYIQRYVDAVNQETWDLNLLFKKIF